MAVDTPKLIPTVHLLGLPYLLKEGTNSCPFCQQSNCFVVNDSHYKCFRPSCGKAGNTFDFLVDLGLAEDFSAALKLVRGNSGNDYRKACISHDLYMRAMNILRSYDDKTGKEYLTSRGLGGVAEQAYYAYTNGTETLKGCGFSKSQLEELGLLNDKGGDLFYNHVLFPVYGPNYKICGLQGRNLDGDSDYRWLNTKKRGYYSNNQGLFNLISNKRDYASDRLVFICEGIPDTLSVEQLGFRAVGTIGLETKLDSFAKFFKDFDTAIAVFDSDQFGLGLGQEFTGRYKSWTRTLPKLALLQQKLPNLSILCAMPPSKDLNDWLQTGLTHQAFLEYIYTNHKPLVPFAFDVLTHPIEQKDLLLVTKCSPIPVSDQTWLNHMAKLGGVNSFLSFV